MTFSKDTWVMITMKIEPRVAFEIIEIYKDLGKSDCDYIKKLKRQIRADLKETPKRKIIKDNGIDGYIELVELPPEIDSPEDAEWWFQYNVFIYPTYSMYDCTGRPFTVWQKLFRRNGHWFAYHSVAFDV